MCIIGEKYLPLGVKKGGYKNEETICIYSRYYFAVHIFIYRLPEGRGEEACTGTCCTSTST